MIEIKIDDDNEVKSYFFPEDWTEVTVKQFCNVYKIKGDDYSQLEYSMILLSTLSGIERETVELMSIDDFKMLLDKLKFITNEVEKIDVESIKVGEDEYYLHSDFNRFTTGEIITIEMILKKANNNLFEVMSELLCIFLRKKKDNGNLEKFKTTFMERKELFENIPVSQVYHIFNFFLTGEHSFNNNTKDFIKSMS